MPEGRIVCGECKTDILEYLKEEQERRLGNAALYLGKSSPRANSAGSALFRLINHLVASVLVLALAYWIFRPALLGGNRDLSIAAICAIGLIPIGLWWLQKRARRQE